MATDKSARRVRGKSPARPAQTPVHFACPARIANGGRESEAASGYLCGLAARLLALAAVFGALVTPPVYQSALEFADVHEVIAGERGRHIDPDVTNAAIPDFKDFMAIPYRYRDDPRWVTRTEPVAAHLQT